MPNMTDSCYERFSMNTLLNCSMLLSNSVVRPSIASLLIGLLVYAAVFVSDFYRLLFLMAAAAPNVLPVYAFELFVLFCAVCPLLLPA